MNLMKEFINITQSTVEYIQKINHNANMQIDDLHSLNEGFNEFLYSPAELSD